MRETAVFMLIILTACVAECIPLLIAGTVITLAVAFGGKKKC